MITGDITERKEAEAALRRSLAALGQKEGEVRSIALFPLQDPYPVLRVDDGGRVLFVNEAGRRVLDAWGPGAGGTLPDDSRRSRRRGLPGPTPAAGRGVRRPDRLRGCSRPGPGRTLRQPLLLGRHGAEAGRGGPAGERGEVPQPLHDDITGRLHRSADGRILDCNPAFARIFGFSSVDEALGPASSKRTPPRGTGRPARPAFGRARRSRTTNGSGGAGTGPDPRRREYSGDLRP